ncbi:YihY/virulence factor BrkB family protein [Rhizomonospora bruguierae]|uniref:YihY/virulence factor BrkB family protein n=1 Tax=Rhizomonospora bruguierae TaxID=1581705 RepID=UPI001BD0F8EC|nr:YhjD/YihY/BrkB family envelope integrity protein [Micromonospora sp. NBRC 107566]
MNPLGRIVTGVEDGLYATRRRWKGFDHIWLAGVRYQDAGGGRLAAAIAYYGFFAVFAIGLLAYAGLGFLLEFNLNLFAAVDHFLRQNLPFLDPAQIQSSRGAIGLVGLLALVLTGIGWIESLRSSQRLIHQLDPGPGHPIIRRFVDLGVLVFVLLLLFISVVAVDALESFLAWVFGTTGPVGTTLMALSTILTIVVNMIVALSLMTAVPRLVMPPRRLLTPVITVALGITVLNTFGRYYVIRTERNPAYTVVTGAVGILLYLYLFSQLLLFGTALAATSRHGRVGDVRSLRLRRKPKPS